MKKNILLIICATLCCLFFFQCHKGCDSKNLGELKFTSTDLAIVPYNGTEHLIFRDSLGDSICYDSTGTRFSQEKWPIYETGDPECPGDNYYCEVNYTHFYANRNSVIWADMCFNPFAANMKKCISFHISYLKNTKTWFFEGNFNFDNLKIYEYTSENTITLNTANIFSFNDSLKIGSKEFYNVYILKQIIKPDKAENLQFVYYSVSKGLVGFKTDEGHLWYSAL